MSNRGTVWGHVYGFGGVQPGAQRDSADQAPPDRDQVASQRKTDNSTSLTDTIQPPSASDEDTVLSEPTYDMHPSHNLTQGKGTTLFTASEKTRFDGVERAFNSSLSTNKAVSDNMAGGEGAAGSRWMVGGETEGGNLSHDPSTKRRKMGANLAPQSYGAYTGDHGLRSNLTHHNGVDAFKVDTDEINDSERLLAAGRSTAHSDRDSESQHSGLYSIPEWSDEEYEAWIVRNNIQRCEAFLFTLEAVVEGCKKRGRNDTLEFLARELEKVIDKLNTPR